MSYLSIKELIENVSNSEELIEKIIDGDCHERDITREQSIEQMKKLWEAMVASVNNYEFRDRLEEMFSNGEFNQYSLVNRCTNLGNTAEAVIKPENYNHKTKCFLFALLDDEMNK
jgi:hypothetical protein